MQWWQSQSSKILSSFLFKKWKLELCERLVPGLLFLQSLYSLSTFILSVALQCSAAFPAAVLPWVMCTISLDAILQWKTSLPTQENHTIILQRIILSSGSILRMYIPLSCLPEGLRGRNYSWGSHQPVGWPPKLIKELLVQQIREVPRVSQGIPTLTLSTIVSVHPQKQQRSSSLLFLTALPFRLLQAPCLPTGSSSSFWSSTTDFWGHNSIKLRELQLLKSSMSKPYIYRWMPTHSRIFPIQLYTIFPCHLPWRNHLMIFLLCI